MLDTGHSSACTGTLARGYGCKVEGEKKVGSPVRHAARHGQLVIDVPAQLGCSGPRRSRGGAITPTRSRNEGRTLYPVECVFIDTFANANTVHIHEISK